jgi:precorrin-6x reductase
MVDRADVLVTVFDGSMGGTAATVRYARERGVEILALWR